MKRMMMLLALTLLITGCAGQETPTETTQNTETSTETYATNDNTMTTSANNDADRVLAELQSTFASLGEDLYAKEFDKVKTAINNSREAVLGLEDPMAQAQLIGQIDQIEEFTTNLEDVAQKCTTDQTAAPVAGDTIATMTTSMGVVKIKLFTCDVPETTKNFITHAENGFYNGLVFHRVIKDFMIQGGDPQGTGMGGYSYKGEGTKFDDEFSPNLKNLNGALSMANSGPNTNGSQFFIVQAPEGTPWLDFKHSVFGQVYEGMDIVNAIADVEVDGSDMPVEDVMIESVTISTL